jgi:Tol biopolymer transport system component
MKKTTAIIRTIGALLALMLFIASCTGGSSSPTATPEPESTSVAMEPTSQPSPTPRPADTRNEGEDPDGDGFIGEADLCPLDSGTVDGCPDNDGDGIENSKDNCPFSGNEGYGIDFNGCPNPTPTWTPTPEPTATWTPTPEAPADSDGDGVADSADLCPDLGDAGLGIDGTGCPIPPPPADSDGDGVTDNIDECPTQGDAGFGLNLVGCPLPDPNANPVNPDVDGDGVLNIADACPNEGDAGFGVDALGCPNPDPNALVDSDGDGIADVTDQCPNEGNIGYGLDVNGCPFFDTDEDGIIDNLDQCPLDGDLGLGVYSDGCPIRADQDRDDDSFFDDVDQCPEEGNIIGDGGSFAVDETGCQPDTDGDGFKDYQDACITQGDEGYGLDGTGCPNPDPFAEVGAPATINMGIAGVCDTSSGVAVVVFTLTNPNDTDINNGYTDQNGVAGVANVPANGTSTVSITPNESGLARIQFDNVTNFAEVSDCVAPDVAENPPPQTIVLAVQSQTCELLNGNYRVVVTVRNDGTGTIPTGTEYLVNQDSPYTFTRDIAPTETFTFSMFSNDGFAVLQIPTYGFYYTNPLPCPEGAVSPDTVRLRVLSAECSQVNDSYFIALRLINDGPGSMVAGTQIITTNNTTTSTNYGGVLAPNQEIVLNSFTSSLGLVTVSIPAYNFSYSNTTPCTGNLPQGIQGMSAECYFADQYPNYPLLRFTLRNFGPNPIPAGTIMTLYGFTTDTVTLPEVAVGQDIPGGLIMPNNSNFARIEIADYGFSYQNTTPCAPAPTTFEQVSYVCGFSSGNAPQVTVTLRNSGANIASRYLLTQLVGFSTSNNGLSSYSGGADVAPGGTFGFTAFVDSNGFVSFSVPAYGYTYTTPEVCPPALPTLSVTATCDDGETGAGLVSITLDGWNTYTINGEQPYTNGVTFPYAFRTDDVVGTEGVATLRDGTQTFPFVRQSNQRTSVITFSYPEASQLMGRDVAQGVLTLPNCLPQHVEYSVSISQSCDADTGINTISITTNNIISLERALTFVGADGDIRAYYQFIGTGVSPVTRNYSIAGGTLAYEFNTNGKDSFMLTYWDPRHVNYNAQRQLGILAARFAGEQFISVPLEICGDPQTPVSPEPTLEVSAECVDDYLGEITFTFDGFNDYEDNGINRFSSGFSYAYTLYLTDETYIEQFTLLGEDGTFTVDFEWQEAWRGKTLILLYTSVQGILSGDTFPTMELPNCLPDAPATSNVNITISQTCNAITGITTIGFDISGAEDLLALLNGNLGNLTPLQYAINDINLTPLQWQDGIQTVDYNSSGASATVQYTNPAYINYVVNNAINGTPLDNPPLQFISLPLEACSISGDFTIPQAPVPVVQSLTCETPNQLVLTIDFGDNEAYTKAVDLLLQEIFSVAQSAVIGIDNLGFDVTSALDVLSLNFLSLDGFTDNLFLSILTVISHTSSLDFNNLDVQNPLLVAASFGGGTRNGTTVSIPMSVFAPPPVGTPLYLTFTNPYVFMNGYLEYILPYAERIKNGDVDAILEMSNGMSAFMTNLTNLTLSPAGSITQSLSAELVGDCFPDNTVEVTPEPETTPDAPAPLVLPPPPTFSVDSITCPSAGTLNITYTNGDFSVYSTALGAVLSQLLELPEGQAFPIDLSSGFDSLGAAFPIVISHTNPITSLSAEYVVAISMTGTSLTTGTFTATVSLTAMGGGIGLGLGNAQIPAGAPLYVNILSLSQYAGLLNTLLQPLVDRYNNGETITMEMFMNTFSSVAGQGDYLLTLLASQQIDQAVVDACFVPLEPNLQIDVTEQCNAETGINTISFTVSGADELAPILDDLNLGEAFPLSYTINGQRGELPYQDGVYTVEVDTNNLFILTVQYLDPAFINALITSVFSDTTPSIMPSFGTRVLTLCGENSNGGEIVIPDLPTPYIESLTCEIPRELVLTVNYGDATTYLNTVDALFSAILGSMGLGDIGFSILDLVGGFDTMVGSVPIFISHTTPIDVSVIMMGGGMPTNIVGYGTGGGMNGNSQSVTISVLLPPPAGAPLYVSFLNPYVALEVFVDALLPLFDRVKNGETLTITDLQNALSSVMGGGDTSALLSSMMTSAELSAELVGDCIVTIETYSVTITEQCDTQTGINTISITQSGADSLATILELRQLPFIINGTEYRIALQDGTQTIAFDTTGLESAQLDYINPDYLNAMVQSLVLQQQQPNLEEPTLTSRNLTICEDVPEVTPTPEATPEITPEPETTSTPEPETTSTPEPEITPVVTIVVPEITPLPTLPPLPTLEPLPTFPPAPTLAPLPTLEPVPPFSLCGVVTFGTDGFPIIDLSGFGCEAQEERPAQNWTPIVVGGAVCLPEIIYHTNETGDWELFWASASRTPENLSNGEGFINLAPTRSPDGLWIAFSSNRDGNWEIYASTVDGSQIIRLTDNDSAVDFDPSWSPDGTKIVYESNVDGNWELRMIDLLTGAKTRLTDHLSPDINPVWHPDGTHIAFQSSREDGLWQIYELEIATGIITRLSDGTSDDTNPQYSPDGESILYKSSNTELRSLFIMNRAGDVTATVMITNTNVNYGIWSSDGAYIAMQETRITGTTVITIYEVATGAVRLLTADNASAFSPAWICDTTNVVFVSNAGGNNDLYVLSATPMDGATVDVTTLQPAIGGDANQRDPQNSPSEEDASRGGNLPPK